MKGLILATGSDGMVGSRFVELYPRKNFLHLPTEVELDITDRNSIKEMINNYRFSCVINFAAYTNVDEAEKQRSDKNGLCWEVNFEGTKNLVDAINPNTTQFIQISTDMVFSGSVDDPGPYSEETMPETELGKLTWYGYTKAEADRYVMDKLGEKATIVRILYPVRAKYNQKLDIHVRKPLELYDQGKLYPLANDQQINISFIDEIAQVLGKIIDNRHFGVFHVASRNLTTPYELVAYVLKKTRGVDPDSLEQITLDELLKKTDKPVYRYPKKGGLEVQNSQKQLDMKFRTWEEIVDELVNQGVGF